MHATSPLDHTPHTPHRFQAAGMTAADARAALRELEEEVRRMDLRQAYAEMRRAQAEVARFREGQRLAQRAAEVGTWGLVFSWVWCDGF